MSLADLLGWFAGGAEAMPGWVAIVITALIAGVGIVTLAVIIVTVFLGVMQIRYSETAMRSALTRSARKSKAMVEKRLRFVDALTEIEMAVTGLSDPNQPAYLQDEELEAIFNALVNGLSNLRWAQELERALIRRAFGGIQLFLTNHGERLKDVEDKRGRFEEAIGNVGYIHRTHETDMAPGFLKEIRESFQELIDRPWEKDSGKS